MKLQAGQMNKFGANPAYTRKVRSEIDGVSVDDLVSKYGSPLYIFSEKQLRERYREINKMFSTGYPNTVLAWSYKTNYLKAICAIMHQEGAMAEVVSAFEYEKAGKLGVSGENIIFNGPLKTIEALDRAVSEGAMINIDHFDELRDLELLSKKMGRKIKVGIRINMDTKIQPQWSRFGFNLESGQALEAVRQMANRNHLILNGLHCHMGTFILEPEAYAKEVEKMVKFACEVKEYFGFTIDYLDLGGGFPSKSRLKGIYLPPDVAVPSLKKYLDAITGALLENLKPGDQPRVILEIGRALVDEVGYAITTVTSSKQLPDSRKAYVIDMGVNSLFTSFWYKFTVETNQKVRGIYKPSVIYGPLCMNIDVIDEGLLLPPLKRGTLLIFSPVGAYNHTQSMQFIEYRPSTLLINEDGEVDIIREREDLSDVEKREKLPERLKLR